MRASVGEACRAEQARRRCQSAASSGPAGAAGRGQRAPGSEAFEARLGGVWDGTERLRTAPWKPGPSPSAPGPALLLSCSVPRTACPAVRAACGRARWRETPCFREGRSLTEKTLSSPQDSPRRPRRRGLSCPPWALPLRETAGLSLGELLSGSATAADSAFCFMARSISTSFSVSMRKAA